MNKECPQSAKKIAILTTAKQLFLSKGFTETSMDLIASESNVSKQTIYTYFQNKENLFQELMLVICSKPECSVDVPTNSETQPKKVLETIGEKFLTMITSDKGSALFRFVIGESTRNPQIAKIFYENGPKNIQNNVAEYFNELHSSGSFNIPDTKQAAIYFISMLQGDIHMQAMLNRPPPTQNEIKRHVKSSVGLFIRQYKND